jgi:hypothetical protein
LNNGVFILGLLAGVFIDWIAFLNWCQMQTFAEPPPTSPFIVSSSAWPLAIAGNAIVVISALGLILTIERQRIGRREALIQIGRRRSTTPPVLDVTRREKAFGIIWLWNNAHMCTL